MTSDADLPHQADTLQQPPRSFEPQKPLALITAILLIVLVAGACGYLLGMRNAQSIPPLQPSPTLTQASIVLTPSPSAGITSEQLPNNLISLLKNIEVFDSSIQWSTIVQKNNWYVTYNGNNKVWTKGYQIIGKILHSEVHPSSFEPPHLISALQNYGWHRDVGADANGPGGEVFVFDKVKGNTVSLLEVENKIIGQNSQLCNPSTRPCLNTVTVSVSDPITIPHLDAVYDLLPHFE